MKVVLQAIFLNLLGLTQIYGDFQFVQLMANDFRVAIQRHRFAFKVFPRLSITQSLPPILQVNMCINL